MRNVKPPYFILVNIETTQFRHLGLVTKVPIQNCQKNKSSIDKSVILYNSSIDKSVTFVILTKVPLQKTHRTKISMLPPPPLSLYNKYVDYKTPDTLKF